MESRFMFYANYKKLLLRFFIFAFVYFFAGFFGKDTLAATCAPGECGDWYACQGGTYCCNVVAGVGACPSYYCEHYLHGCWYLYPSGSGVCRTKVAGSCPGIDKGTELDVGGRECYACAGIPPCTETSPAATTLISPANNSVFYDRSNITFTWNSISDWGENCGSNNTKNYKLYVKKNSGSFVLITTTTGTSYTYTLPVENATYQWYVKTDNGAKSADSSTFTFTNYMFMSLTLRVQEVSWLTNSCPSADIYRPLANVSVTVVVRRSTGEVIKHTGKTDASGILIIPVRYSTTSPPVLDICLQYSEAMCQVYNLKCRDNVLLAVGQNCASVTQLANTTSQTVNLQMSKVKKDSWIAVVDSDGLASEYTSLGPCTTEQVLGGFYGAMLNIHKLPANSNIYALSLLDQFFPSDIVEGSGGGYAKNIGEITTVEKDLNFEAPETAKTLNTISGFIKPGIYRMSVDAFNNSPNDYFFTPTGCVYGPPVHMCSPDNFYCFDSTNYPTYCKPWCETAVVFKCDPTDVCYSEGAPGDCYPYCVQRPACGSLSLAYIGDNAPRVAVVYVDGTPADEIVVNSTIRALDIPDASTAPGNIIFITRAKIRIPANLAAPLAGYGIGSPSQINAVLVSSTGITVDSQYTPATPDNPIIFDGALISTKANSSTDESIKLLRDLGIDNNTYPATVIRYPLNLLKQINGLIKLYSEYGIDTGLESFDIEFDYSPSGETGVQ